MRSHSMLAFVVVDGDPAGLLDEMRQLVAVEHRQALARVEHEGDAGGLELLGVLKHGVAPVGGDDAQADVAARGARPCGAPASWRRGGRR
jgi:hypothetical protein